MEEWYHEIDRERVGIIRCRDDQFAAFNAML